MIRLQSLGHCFVVIDSEHFKAFIPVYRRQIVEMVIFVQIDRVQETPLFGCDVVVIFFLYAEGVRENTVFHPTKNIGLTVAGNLSAQVTDNEDLVIMLENNAFPEQNSFQAYVGWSEYFIC